MSSLAIFGPLEQPSHRRLCGTNCCTACRSSPSRRPKKRLGSSRAWKRHAGSVPKDRRRHWARPCRSVTTWCLGGQSKSGGGGVKGRFIPPSPRQSHAILFGPLRASRLIHNDKRGEKGGDPEGSHPVHVDRGFEDADDLKEALGRRRLGRMSRRGKFWH